MTLSSCFLINCARLLFVKLSIGKLSLSKAGNVLEQIPMQDISIASTKILTWRTKTDLTKEVQKHSEKVAKVKTITKTMINKKFSL